MLKEGTKVDSFAVGQETTVDLKFTNAKEGSTWKVALHSTPVDLGTVTVSSGKATLHVTKAQAAQFVAGTHTLVVTPLSDKDAKVIRIPWKVAPQTDASTPGIPPAAGPNAPQHSDSPTPQTNQSKSPQSGHAPTTPTVQNSSTQQKAVTQAKNSMLASTGTDAALLAPLGALFLAARFFMRRTRH